MLAEREKRVVDKQIVKHRGLGTREAIQSKVRKKGYELDVFVGNSTTSALLTRSYSPTLPHEVKALEPDFRKRRGLFACSSTSSVPVDTINEGAMKGLLLHHGRSAWPKPRASRYSTFVKENIAQAIVSVGRNSGKDVGQRSAGCI